MKANADFSLVVWNAIKLTSPTSPAHMELMMIEQSQLFQMYESTKIFRVYKDSVTGNWGRRPRV